MASPRPGKTSSIDPESKANTHLQEFVKVSLKTLQALEEGLSSKNYPSPNGETKTNVKKNGSGDPAALFKKSRNEYLKSFRALQTQTLLADADAERLKAEKENGKSEGKENEKGKNEKHASDYELPSAEELEKLERLKAEIIQKNKALKVLIERFRALRLCLNSMS
mmetsp:Transcript_8043/g.10192  ORF Transcript_8043/g.10192 Transcript_8043/m.10192 type:complete len:166 (-) Transcript_8043:1590-2087(-)